MQMMPQHYLEASQEKIETARRLFADQDLPAAIFWAGVGVECLLRAYKTRDDAVFDSRHDLLELVRASGIAAFMSEEEFRKLAVLFGNVWTRWKSNYRYASEDRLRSEFRRLKLNRGIKGDHLKQNASILIESSLSIIGMGVARWKSKKS